MKPKIKLRNIRQIIDSMTSEEIQFLNRDVSAGLCKLENFIQVIRGHPGLLPKRQRRIFELLLQFPETEYRDVLLRINLMIASRMEYERVKGKPPVKSKRYNVNLQGSIN